MIQPFIPETNGADDPKNSKILSRKQIEKRLEGLKMDDYEKISKNLKSQNNKLKNQVKILNEKVQELIQVRKIQKTTKNPQIQQQIIKLKKQLDLKYESMNYLKEQIRKQTQTDMTDDVRLRIKQNQNHLFRLEAEIKQLTNEQQKLKISTSQHDQSMKQYLPTLGDDEKIESLKYENRALKQKINKKQEQLKSQEKDSQFTINKIYTLKEEQKKRSATSSSKDISSSLPELNSPGNQTNISELEKEIEDLKNRKKDLEKDLTAEKIIKESKKMKLEQEIKNLLEYQKELHRRKVKSYNQLNLYQRKEALIREALEKQKVLQNAEYENQSTQTDKIVQMEFRKEWIGKSQGLPFNDANIIEYRGDAEIKAAIAYKSSNQNISFIKFIYETPQKKKYQSEPPFDKALLKKLEAKKIQSKSNACLIGLTVSISNKKVNRIEFRWADGDSSVVGWEVENSVKFGFDLDPKQRPICMFGTVSYQGKSIYSLESLGCEINSFDN